MDIRLPVFFMAMVAFSLSKPMSTRLSMSDMVAVVLLVKWM